MKYENLSETEKDQYAKDIEKRLSLLINSLEDTIANKTIKEAKHYLKHREWKLCLQNLGYDYIEPKIPISEHSYNEMVSLCITMGIPNDGGDSWFYEKLLERHSQQ
ncbi:hypothetical protein ACU6U9_17865 [Pseudomonas sp. HK3]